MRMNTYICIGVGAYSRVRFGKLIVKDLPQNLWPHVAVKIQVSCVYIHTRKYVYMNILMCLRVSGLMMLLRCRCHVRMYIHVSIKYL